MGPAEQMEADWELEIGGDAPVIEACWSGFVDLRADPDRISELAECREFPSLADAVIRLNAADSPVWTSKVDVFTPERIDPDEVDATPEETARGISCYIDLLQRKDQIWNDRSKADHECRKICACLRGIELRQCRVDMVVRRALVADTYQLGATVYVTACGRTIVEAKEHLGECLDALTTAIVPASDGRPESRPV
jgi:hypothetical protein